MRILQVIPTLGTGGAEKMVLEITERLNRSGVRTDLLLLNDTPSPLLDRARAAGIRVHVTGSGDLRGIYDPRHIFRIRPFLEGYDVVHAHLTAAQYWCALSRLTLRRGAHLVTTEHSPRNRRFGKWYFRLADRFVYSLFGRIIAISADTACALQSYIGLPPEGIELIENGIDLPAYRGALPYPRAELTGDPRCETLLLQVAGFRNEKDHDTVIRALGLLPESVHLALAGDGIRRPVLESLCAEYDVERRVHFLGVRTDVPRLLRSADILLVSSHWEGLSLACVEGMASGTPLVASDVRGVRELAGGNGLLFREGDERELAHRVTSLLGDPSLRRLVSTRCAEKALRYDINKVINRHKELYRALTRRKPTAIR